MGYRIRIAPEVEQWLAELRESDPGAADLANLVLAECHQVAALVEHLAFEARIRIGDQPHHRHHRHALAGA